MRLLAAILALVILAAPAYAEKRVALVIGNAAYKNAPVLQNPRNDAQDVAEALKRLGFETIVGLDLDDPGMKEKSIAFARAVRDADIALFYYSGHAMQFSGVNYLVPVDAVLRDEADLRRLTRVDDTVADLKQARNVRILVLDACRDNPLAEELSRSMGASRGLTVDRGLAKIIAARGMIVSYATQTGQTAFDGIGRNSPYTAAFLRHIEGQQEIGTVFRRISADVYEVTKHEQLPELSISLVGEFYMRGRADLTLSIPTPSDPCAAAADHWKSAEAIGTQAAFEDHLARYPNCAYAGLARVRIDDFRKREATSREAELLFWNSIKDSQIEADFQDYLRRFPSGTFATLAQDHLDAIKRAQVAALEAPRVAAPPRSELRSSTAGGEFSCALENSLKSLVGDQSVMVTFRNLLSETISTYWLDYTGKRVFYQRINAGGSYTQQTYISHPWVLVDGRGQCRKIILPGDSQRVVTIP
jgi:uncharacterized caspase-like protein